MATSSMSASTRKKPNRKAEGKAPPSHDDPKRIVLLAVSGMSPAILTETVWALAKETPPVIPDDIHVITTTKGAADITSDLHRERPEWGGQSAWSALRRSILGDDLAGSMRLQLSAPRVIELPDPKSGVKRPADDLRTPADNAAAADFILDEVRRLTENPDVRVIASIAGGRKTMGALLYAAMSLLGRETDRLTHVLVNEPFDQCRDFLFPSQPAQDLVAGRENTPIEAANARLDLADIPFVPLRNLFERDFARPPGSFARLVAEASRILHPAGPLALRVFQDKPAIEVDGVEIGFSQREHVLFLLLAKNCAQGLNPYPTHDNAHSAYLEFVGTLKAGVNPDDFNDWRWKLDACSSVNMEDMKRLANSIREKLRRSGAAGVRLAKALPPRAKLGLQVDPGAIEFC